MARSKICRLRQKKISDGLLILHQEETVTLDI